MIELSLEQTEQFQNEFKSAIQARQQGLEGRSRVCARRAAGILARAWLTRFLPGERSSNLQFCLVELQGQQSLSPDVQLLISHFTTTVDDAYHLPDQIDLIADLKKIKDGLEITLKDDTND
jgi:hypothetical protein